LASGPKCWGKQKHYAKCNSAPANPSTLFAREHVIVLSNWTKLSQLHIWRGVMYITLSASSDAPHSPLFPRRVTTLCRQTNFETRTFYLSNLRQIMITAGHWVRCFMM
jgi:hypothetical protein